MANSNIVIIGHHSQVDTLSVAHYKGDIELNHAVYICDGLI